MSVAIEAMGYELGEPVTSYFCVLTLKAAVMVTMSSLSSVCQSMSY